MNEENANTGLDIRENISQVADEHVEEVDAGSSNSSFVDSTTTRKKRRRRKPRGYVWGIARKKKSISKKRDDACPGVIPADDSSAMTFTTQVATKENEDNIMPSGCKRTLSGGVVVATAAVARSCKQLTMHRFLTKARSQEDEEKDSKTLENEKEENAENNENKVDQEGHLYNLFKDISEESGKSPKALSNVRPKLNLVNGNNNSNNTLELTTSKIQRKSAKAGGDFVVGCILSSGRNSRRTSPEKKLANQNTKQKNTEEEITQGKAEGSSSMENIFEKFSQENMSLTSSNSNETESPTDFPTLALAGKVEEKSTTVIPGQAKTTESNVSFLVKGPQYQKQSPLLAPQSFHKLWNTAPQTGPMTSFLTTPSSIFRQDTQHHLSRHRQPLKSSMMSYRDMANHDADDEDNDGSSTSSSSSFSGAETTSDDELLTSSSEDDSSDNDSSCDSDARSKGRVRTAIHSSQFTLGHGAAHKPIKFNTTSVELPRDEMPPLVGKQKQKVPKMRIGIQKKQTKKRSENRETFVLGAESKKAAYPVENSVSDILPKARRGPGRPRKYPRPVEAGQGKESAGKGGKNAKGSLGKKGRKKKDVKFSSEDRTPLFNIQLGMEESEASGEVVHRKRGRSKKGGHPSPEMKSLKMRINISQTKTVSVMASPEETENDAAKTWKSDEEETVKDFDLDTTNDTKDLSHDGDGSPTEKERLSLKKRGDPTLPKWIANSAENSVDCWQTSDYREAGHSHSKSNVAEHQDDQGVPQEGDDIESSSLITTLVENGTDVFEDVNEMPFESEDRNEMEEDMEDDDYQDDDIREEDKSKEEHDVVDASQGWIVFFDF